MDAGRFKILKYNGEGVDPGAFDGTGTGDLPLVISANKSKDRSVVKQQMTLQGSEGELPQVIELQQGFVPLFVDNSLSEKGKSLDIMSHIHLYLVVCVMDSI